MNAYEYNLEVEKWTAQARVANDLLASATLSNERRTELDSELLCFLQVSDVFKGYRDDLSFKPSPIPEGGGAFSPPESES